MDGFIECCCRGSLRFTMADGHFTIALAILARLGEPNFAKAV